MSATATRKARKSIKLSANQMDYIRREDAKYDTKMAKAIGLKMNPDVIARILLTGVCHEKSYRILFPNDPVPEKNGSSS